MQQRTWLDLECQTCEPTLRDERRGRERKRNEEKEKEKEKEKGKAGKMKVDRGRGSERSDQRVRDRAGMVRQNDLKTVMRLKCE